MIKKLRTKFVLVAMIATTLVLGAIMCAINVRSYTDVCSRADKTLLVLTKNNGSFPEENPAPPDKPDQNDGGIVPSQGDRNPGDGMSPEAPFETRYFTVTFLSDGTTSVNADKIAAVSEEQAASIAKTLREKNKSDGFYGSYKFTLFTNKDGNDAYVFLDCSRELDSYKTFLKTSVSVSIAGLVVVFILIYVSSYFVMKPVARAYEKQKQFITDANHELKTPLTIIGANCDILSYGGDKDECAAEIKTQVERLTGLTEKLIELSRLDEQSQKTVKTPFPLSETVKLAIEPYYSLCRAENKDFSARIDEGLSLVGDSEKIKNLVSLLMDNAVKYSDDNGRISLTLVGKGKNHAVLTVENTTNGVPEGNLDVLFERFYRLDKSRSRKIGGSGIGLSVAKAIVEAHNGKITAYSPDGRKIVFVVKL